MSDGPNDANDVAPVERWEKAETVLWAFTPEGIVLHNFARGVFLELDGTHHFIWSYLDGAHTADQIVRRLAGHPPTAAQDEVARRAVVIKLVAELVEGGFLVEVP